MTAMTATEKLPWLIDLDTSRIRQQFNSLMVINGAVIDDRNNEERERMKERQKKLGGGRLAMRFSRLVFSQKRHVHVSLGTPVVHCVR